MQPNETTQASEDPAGQTAPPGSSGWADAADPQWTLVSAAEIGGQNSQGQQPIGVAIPPMESVENRETRPGQSGSASEQANEADTPSSAAGVAYGVAGGALNDGPAEPEAREPRTQQPNSWGPPPESSPGSSPLTVQPEGGSQFVGAVSSGKEEAPGQDTSGDRPGYDQDGNPLPGADGTVSMDDWIRLNDQDGDGQVDTNLVDLSGGSPHETPQQESGQNPLEDLVRQTTGRGQAMYDDARQVSEVLQDGVPERTGLGFRPGSIPSGDVPRPYDNTGPLPDQQLPSDGPKGPQDRAEQRANAESNRTAEGDAPIPVAEAGGSPLDSGVRPGPRIEIEHADIGDLVPGEMTAVPNVGYEQEGVGLREPIVGHGNGLNHTDDMQDQEGNGRFPETGGRLDVDGDGRPDVLVPGVGTTAPEFVPPQRGPGLTAPEDLGLRQPGPEFEPGVEQPVPPPGGYVPPPDGPTEPRLEHESPGAPPAGRLNGEPDGYGQGSGAPAEPGDVRRPVLDTSPSAQAATTAVTGASLDVFQAREDAPPVPDSPGVQVAEAGEQAPDSAAAGGEPASSSWTLTSAATLTLYQSESAPSVDTHGGAGSEQHGDFFPLADFLGTLNLTADAGRPYPPDVKTDDPNFLERIIDMIRGALFLSDDKVSDEAMAMQLSALEPAVLLELERQLAEQGDVDEWGSDPGDDGMDA